MEIKYDVEIPVSDKEDVNTLFKFHEGEHKNMMITYHTEAEASSRASVLRSTCKRKRFNIAIKRIGVDVYFEKQ